MVDNKNNKDIEDLDIAEMVRQLLTPIDKIRSQSSEGYLESRCNAFYRMMGFPTVSSKGNFYSPGYDINLNMNAAAKEKQTQVDKEIATDNSLSIKQLAARETHYKDYTTLFSAGGFNATAIALGSVFIRSFERQFGTTEPLAFDENQIQSVSQRDSELYEFYNTPTKIDAFNELKNAGKLFATHLLKPFIVDPSIAIVPDEHLIAAPFLLDASQLKNFLGLSYPRPYIERVISIRFNNQNFTGKSPNITDIISGIKSNETIIDAYLLSIANNPQKELQTSDAVIFGTYLKLMRSLINRLVVSIKEVFDARKSINFQPIPDKKNGLEGAMSLSPVDKDDGPRNTSIENNIINLYNAISLNDSSFSSDASTDGSADTVGFVFSELNDIVFSADKVEQISNQQQLDDLKKSRDGFGEPAIEELRNIEYIMGEFSGLGIIDVVAIQSAFWLMDKDKLLGLIDDQSYERLVKKRKNLNVSGANRNTDVLSCLTEYETKLKQVYTILQLHFDQVLNGKVYNP
jgi:hypothetical protein